MNTSHGELQNVNDAIWQSWRSTFWKRHAIPLVCVGMGTEDDCKEATIAMAKGADLEEIILMLESTVNALKERANQ